MKFEPNKQDDRTFRILKVVSAKGYSPKRKKKKNKGERSYKSYKNY